MAYKEELISLRFLSNGEFITAYTFTNGKVSAPALLQDISIIIESSSASLNDIMIWMDHVRMINNPDEGAYEEEFSSEIECEEDSAKLKLNIGEFIMNAVFDNDSKLLTFKARPQFTISWAAFCDYIAQYNYFLNMVKTQFTEG
jgi:hypothetical protein